MEKSTAAHDCKSVACLSDFADSLGAAMGKGCQTMREYDRILASAD
jgi:hypothetical protein